MPIESLWALVVSLAMLAFGCAIQAATYAHRLKMADNELAAFFAKLDTLKKENDEKISNISQLHKAEVEKLQHSYSEAVEKAIESAFERTRPRNALLDYAKSHSPPPKNFLAQRP